MAFVKVVDTLGQAPAATETLDKSTDHANQHELYGLDGDDYIAGANHADGDKLYGGEGDDTMYGFGGPDIIYGGEGRDTLYAASDSDDDTDTTANILEGGDGDDLIYGSSGDDKLYGGSGDDTLYGMGGTDLIYGGDGSDSIDLSDSVSNLEIDLSSNSSNGDRIDSIENIRSGSGNDVLDGDENDNIIEGGPGSDTIDCGERNNDSDTVSYQHSDGYVVVNLASNVHEGHDAEGLVGMVLVDDSIANCENILGSGYNDVLTGDGEDNIIRGGNGDDYIEGGLGVDTLIGGEAGETNGDTLSYANAENGVEIDLALTTQNAVGNINPDYQDITREFENLRGSDHNDTLSGDAGNNVIEGASGEDFIDCKGGTADKVSYENSAAHVIVDLFNNDHSSGDAAGDSIANCEGIIGSDHNDTLTGDASANNIDGLGGDDTIDGHRQDDTLAGGNGTDTLSYASVADVGCEITIDLNAMDQGGLFVNGGGCSLPSENDSASGFENAVGGSGDDTIDGSSLANILSGGPGNDIISGKEAGDTLNGGLGNDTLYASDSVPTNDNAINQLNGGDGNDSLHGSNGADVLNGGNDNDTARGYAGNDTLDGGNGTDVLSYDYVTDADCVITASIAATADQGGVFTGENCDYLGEDDNATNFESLVGGSGADVLVGIASSGSVAGGGGNDELSGSLACNGEAGDDTLHDCVTADGGDGNDYFYDNAVNNGGEHSDVFDGSRMPHNAVINGGAHACTDPMVPTVDIVDYSDYDQAITIDLAEVIQTISEGVVHNFANIEAIVGSDFADEIHGDTDGTAVISTPLRINGLGGDDVISGAAGSDYLSGGHHGSQGNNTVGWMLNSGFDDGGTAETNGNEVEGDYISFEYRSDLEDGAEVDLSTSYYDVNRGTAMGQVEMDTIVFFENIIGSPHNDLLNGDNSRNIIYGRAGDDEINGNGGANHLYGEEGNDTITGGTANDEIYGGDDNDVIDGKGSGDIDCSKFNLLFGDNGTDTFVVSVEADNRFFGGAGTDTVDYSALEDNQSVKIWSPDNNINFQNDFGAVCHNFTSIEKIKGSPSFDNIRVFEGLIGVYGGAGGDIIDADTYDIADVYMEGGDDQDTLIGGTGVQKFVLSDKTADTSWMTSVQKFNVVEDVLVLYKSMCDINIQNPVVETSAGNVEADDLLMTNWASLKAIDNPLTKCALITSGAGAGQVLHLENGNWHTLYNANSAPPPSTVVAHVTNNKGIPINFADMPTLTEGPEGFEQTYYTTIEMVDDDYFDVLNNDG